jgi:uncharacterized membrane protein YkoI
MTDKLKGVLIAIAAVAALAVGGAAFAGAASGGDEPAQRPAEAELTADPSDGAEPGETSASEAAEQATGARAKQAAQAALDAVGGGTVLEVEHADDGASGFEVEIERADGTYVEVNLDESLKVVATGSDD